MKIQSFISLDLPQSLRHELSGHAKLIAGQYKRQKIRWHPPENYHLTLVFSGNVESVNISTLQLALERKLESTKAVPLTISAITPFPFSRHRIAATLVEQTAGLLQLQRGLLNCVRKYGITPERRRFVPHVTLGRLEPSAGKIIDFQVRNILLSGIAYSGTLFQSELTPDGAIHPALVEITLRTLPE